jgi:hypothetical protein
VSMDLLPDQSLVITNDFVLRAAAQRA